MGGDSSLRACSLHALFAALFLFRPLLCVFCDWRVFAVSQASSENRALEYGWENRGPGGVCGQLLPSLFSESPLSADMLDGTNAAVQG